MGVRHQPARDIVRRIMPARHFLRLAQHATAGLHVIVVDLRGRGGRRIGEAQRVRVELAHLADAQRIGFLVEGDGVLFPALHVTHHDARQRILALHADQPVLQHDIADDEDAGPVRDQVLPVLLARIGHGRGDELVVLGTALVGADDELIGTVLDVIFDAFDTRCDDAGLVIRILRIDQPDLGGVMIVDADGNPLLRIGLAHAGELAGVLLLVDQRIGGLLRTQMMAECLQRAVVVILQRIEVAPAAGRPCCLARSVLQHVLVLRAGGSIAHVELVELGAVAVERPGDQVLVG